MALQTLCHKPFQVHQDSDPVGVGSTLYRGLIVQHLDVHKNTLIDAHTFTVGVCSGHAQHSSSGSPGTVAGLAHGDMKCCGVLGCWDLQWLPEWVESAGDAGVLRTLDIPAPRWPELSRSPSSSSLDSGSLGRFRSLREYGRLTAYPNVLQRRRTFIKSRSCFIF